MSLGVNDIISVDYKGRCFGQRIILTTKYIKSAGPEILPNADEVNLLIDDLIVGGGVDVLTDYMACLAPEYALEEIRAQRIYIARDAYVQRLVATPGTHASSATVANDSACITLRTDQAGRNDISNKHIGPIPDAVSVAGLLTAGYRTLLANLATKLLTPAVIGTGETWRPIVTGPHPVYLATLLTTAIVGVQSRVQRRRTVGLGE